MRMFILGSCQTWSVTVQVAEKLEKLEIDRSINNNNKFFCVCKHDLDAAEAYTSGDKFFYMYNNKLLKNEDAT